MAISNMPPGPPARDEHCAESGTTAVSDWPEPGRYEVLIEGITEPATFTRLGDALAALWDSLRVLPLGWTQFEAYRYFFGDGAQERVTTFLARDGQLSLSFAMEGRSHAIRLRPVRDNR